VDTKYIQAKADEYTKIVIQCERHLPADSTALLYLKQRVDDFKQTMPIVKALANENLQPVHWEEIKQLLKVGNFPLEDRNFKLKELMERQTYGV